MMETIKKIKIGYLSTAVTFGGSDRVNINFLTHVNREKYDIRPIIFIRPWEKIGTYVKELEKLNYEYIKIPVAKEDRRDYVRIFRCLRIMVKIFKKEKYDLIHTHGYLADVLGISVAKSLGMYTISTIHGFIWNNWKYKVYNLIQMFMLIFANKIIAVSEEIKKELKEIGIKGEIEVIKNAVEIEESCRMENISERKKSLGISEGDVVLGFIGRLSAEKGIIYLIEAVKNINKIQGNAIKTIIIGDGPQKEEIERRIVAQDAKEDIKILGFKEDINAWIDMIDILVMPSITEGTPMTLLEAMGKGKAVIASNVGGIPDVIQNDINGIIISAKNSFELAAKIQLLASKKEMRNKLGQNARKTIAENYNINNWTRQIERNYDSLLIDGRKMN